MHSDNTPQFTRRSWIKTMIVGLCGGAMANTHGKQPLEQHITGAAPKKVSRIASGKAVACAQ